MPSQKEVNPNYLNKLLYDKKELVIVSKQLLEDIDDLLTSYAKRKINTIKYQLPPLPNLKQNKLDIIVYSIVIQDLIKRQFKVKKNDNDLIISWEFDDLIKDATEILNSVTV